MDNIARIRKCIVRAALLTIEGKQTKQIAETLGVHRVTVSNWRRRYPVTWKAAMDAAMESIASVVAQVRAAVGTRAVVTDADAHLERARLADRFLAEKGEQLFPSNGDLTLSRFYEVHYVPLRMADNSPAYAQLAEVVLRRWTLITGNPPLAEITGHTLALFRDALLASRGEQPYRRMSSRTVRGYMGCVQTLLDKAGPTAPRNRDAAGLLSTVPWCKPPRWQAPVPRTVTLEQISDAYLAAVGMEQPRLWGMKPPAWWKCLIAVAFNTALRHGTLFKLRMEWIDWPASRLVVPGPAMKSRRPQVIHLNRMALEHLRSIRTDRELVFPWVGCPRQFYYWFHRLQDLAAIPRAEHFGLHDLRRSVATLLWEHSPAAAQFALGHTTDDVTRRHYVDGGPLVARALDTLPQPEAFAPGGRAAG